MHQLKVCAFQPDFLALCEQVELGTLITLLNYEMLGVGNSVLSVGSQISNGINLELYGGHGGWSLWVVCTWGVTHDEVKRGLGSGQVGPGVVYILGKQEPVMLGGLAVVYEDVEILFEPLICVLRLAICLRVVSNADILLDAYFSTDISGKLGCQSRVLIQNDLLWNTIVWKDLFKIDFG